MAVSKVVIIIPILAVGIYLLKQYMMGGECKTKAKINGKVVLVTGANVGLGKATAEDLVRRGGRVIMACRSMERGEKAAEDIIHATGAPRSQLKVMELDLSSLASIRKFADEFKRKERRLDILINNAGVMWVPYTKTVDGFELTFGVNHLGHFLLTNLLIDVLKQSAPSRVITVSSLAHEMGTINFDDLMREKDYSSNAAYSQSKLANVLFSNELARRLEGTGVTTYAVHPGAVKTELSRHVKWLHYRPIRMILSVVAWPFAKDAQRGAQTQICCAVDPSLAQTSGKYYGDCAEKPAAEQAQDEHVARKLWDISKDLVKLGPEESA